MAKQTLKKPRGRPRGFDEDEALDAATRVFGDKGYQAASLSDLTAAMGINRVSMYATFGNKEALFRKAMDRYTKATSIQIEACLSAGTARQATERLVCEAVKIATAPDPRGICFVTQGAPEATDETRRYVAQMRAEIERALRRRLERAIEEGELPPTASAEHLARFYAVMIQGLALQAQHGATKEQLLHVVDVAMNHWPK